MREAKPVTYAECGECGDVYATVGDVPIRLAHPRPVGNAKTGTCPKHPVRG